MLEKEFALLVSFLIFIPALIVFVIRKKSLEEIINYIFIHITITIVIAESIFPLIVQRAIIADEVYIKEKQTIEFFTELKTILSLEVTNSEMCYFLKLHIITVILPLFTMGILVGLVLKLQIKSVKKFIIASFVVMMLIQMLKLIVCVITRANYIQVTSEDGLYIFIGCLCGAGLLKLIQNLIKNIDYKSRFFSALKNTLLR